MKATSIVLALCCAAVVGAAPAPEPRPRLRVTGEMEREFERRAGAGEGEASARDDSELELVELAPLQVRGREDNFIFDEERRRLREVPFTWREGGTFYRNYGEKSTTELKFQYDPANNVVRFLTISF